MASDERSDYVQISARIPADLAVGLERSAELIADLEATRWTGRPGYPIRAMIGMALAKSI
jgi:hypothetical protein